MKRISRRGFLTTVAAAAGAAPAAPRIDGHVHFWRYDQVEYPWISAPLLKRNFEPQDLKPELDRAGIASVMAVEARSGLKETDWLLDLAERHSLVAGVVGWLPLDRPELPRLLERYAARPKLRAVRTGVAGGGRPERRKQWKEGLRAVARAGLACDFLISENQLPEVLSIAGSIPELRLVIDHLAKPRIREKILSPWRENIREAARRPGVFCKLSGLVNAAGPRSWTPQDLKPYIDIALEAFGPRRILFGSDWPICLGAANYQQWFHAARLAVASLSAEEQAWIFGRSAAQAYRLTA